MKECIKKSVADFLHQIGRSGIAHHRRACRPPYGRAREACRDEGRAGPMPAFQLCQVHFLVNRA